MSPILDVLEGSARDLGDGFRVRRTLPQRARRALGPFVFWDEVGPAAIEPGRGLDVRPHPHIGLATVTFLFEGAILHRDTLGSRSRIVPGDVNLMVAGSGIVHSERTPDDLRASGHRVHGIQAWVGLPRAEEERPPSFHHVPGADLPAIVRPGLRGRLILGEGFGLRSPAPVSSPTVLADLQLDRGARTTIDPEHEQRAVYVLSGRVRVGASTIAPGRLAVLEPAASVDLCADAPAHVMLLGGAPLDGERLMFWNFVSSRRHRIDEAKRDWWRATGSGFTEGPFRLPPEEHESIALPGEPDPGPPPCSDEHPTS